MERKIHILVILIAVLFLLAGCKKKRNDIVYDRNYLSEVKAAREELIVYLGRNRIPGASVAVSKGGTILYSEGIGLASTDLEVPVSRNTKFRIGQLSENLTALVYHKLIEEGLLHPDSTVQHYLPFFPKKEYSIPIKHLVQHTSGIRTPTQAEKDYSKLNLSIQKGLDQFIADSIAAPPGVYQFSSMFNYNLLGSVMEKTTDKPFHEILKKYLTDTLNLTNTVVDNPFSTIKGRTNFFDHNFVAQVMHATTRDMRYKAPSEGILSNAEDLVKLGNALLYSEYFSEDIKRKVFEPVVLQTGITAQMTNGWLILTDLENRLVYGKSGNVTGGSASLIIFPEAELIVACTTNLTALTDDLPVFIIANHFLQEDV